MKKTFITIIIFIFIVFAGSLAFIYLSKGKTSTLTNPFVKPPIPTPLLAYTFKNLRKTPIPQSQITFGEKVDEKPDYFSQMFYYETPEKPGSKIMKKVSGLANFPAKPGNYPVIVMYRGFIPDNTYTPGAGTEPSAKVFAANGYITLAPDFLGFGQSDKPSSDSFENRFQTYTTALSLLSSLPTLNSGLEASYSGTLTADTSKTAIWGHSNGGHIALSVLAITEATYPTVLWAPVSKSFPYSIIYYTDEADDQGKALRKVLSQFEEIYNTDLFSPPKYYSWIKAPIEIHQGEADHEVPVWWSDDLVDTLKKQGNDVTYFTYSGADHNLRPDAWDTAVTRSLEFYNKELKEP